MAQSHWEKQQQERRAEGARNLEETGQAGIGKMKTSSAVATATGREDVAGAREEKDLYEADARGARSRAGREMTDLRDEFDADRTATTTGATEALGMIEQTGEDIKGIPNRMREDVAAGQAKINDSVRRAEGLIGEDKAAALAGVMEGRSEMLQSAVSGAHQRKATNDAKLDAMVAQGQLSAAQGQQMKMTYNMQENMGIAGSIGEVAQGYTQMATDTHIAFGEMLKGVETAGIGATGTLQATGVQAIGAAETAVGNMNVALSQQTSNVIQERSTNLRMLTEARAVAESTFNEYARAMLPEMHQPFIPASMVEYNNFATTDQITRTEIKKAASDEQLNLMRDMIENQQQWQGVDLLVDIFRIFGEDLIRMVV